VDLFGSAKPLKREPSRVVPSIDLLAVYGLSVRVIGDAALIQPAFERAGSQGDNLCGAFWANLALTAFMGAGFPDEEEVALAAGTVVLAGPTVPEESLPWGGAGPVQPTWPYRLDLPIASDASGAGTSAAGVAIAVARMSGGRLRALAVRADQWTGALVVDLLNGLSDLGQVPILAVANVQTGFLRGSLLSFEEILGHLTLGSPLSDPSAEWDVGHFLSLAGFVTGPMSTLVVVRDTYKALGWNGYHLQSPDAVASALHRNGSASGGLLLIVTDDLIGPVRAILDRFPVFEEFWHNGSPSHSSSQHPPEMVPVEVGFGEKGIVALG
jgi:hypothetical protein